MAEMNTRVLLKRRPVGASVPEDFEIVQSPLPIPEAGQVLVRHRFVSLDPYMRGRMSDAKSYSAPVALGAVMEAAAAGEVIASNDPRFAPGDTVMNSFGWQQFAAVPASRLIKVDPAEAPLSANLGVLGMPGLTAWVGLEDIGQPKPGETVVISAASGAVGQVAGQIARLRGARVVGIAGGAAKCAFVKDRLGFDTALDHHGDLAAQLDAACPEGVDVYWENVGGKVQEAVFPRLRDFARMVMCGMISQYNEAPGADATGAPAGPNLGPVVRKRLRIQGFIVSDSGWQRYAGFRQEMLGWMKAGKLIWREDVVDGIEKMPEAFIGLLKGRNFGKLVVRVG